MAYIAEITRYPVKGLGGESLQSATIEETGLENDRVCALVGADGNHINQLRYPQLAEVSAAIGDGILTLQANGMEDFSTTLTPDNAREIEVIIYDHNNPTSGIEIGGGEWISDYLSQTWRGRSEPVRIVRKPDNLSRSVKPGYGDDTTVRRLAYPDRFGLSVMSDNSLGDFNSQAGLQAPARNFRANLRIGGDDWAAWAEERGVAEVTIGDGSDRRFSFVRAIDRCPIINGWPRDNRIYKALGELRAGIDLTNQREGRFFAVGAMAAKSAVGQLLGVGMSVTPSRLRPSGQSLVSIG